MAISRLPALPVDSPRQKIVAESVENLLRMKTADRLWFFRTQAARMGIGRWNDMPKCLKTYMQELVLHYLHDDDWVQRVAGLAHAYDRTWSVNPLGRFMLMIACFEALSHAVEVNGTPHA